jgi:WhiB family redox-sensing transcriptional regulator
MASRPVPLTATTGIRPATSSEGLAKDWTTRGACRSGDPDALFVQGAAQNSAKIICRECPVRVECLADALDNRVEFGVWGGMTERERRALLRRRPNVTSWQRLLEAAVRDQATDRPISVLSAVG